jgi:hypothetical protein
MDYGLNNQNDLHEKLTPTQNRDIQSSSRSDVADNLVDRPSLADIMTVQFYQRPKELWFEELCEGLFKIRIRGTTIKAEIYFGLIHYISCFYCLAVIPSLMEVAGYERSATFLSIAIMSGLGCIVGGLVANLPFPFAPPTVISIFLSSSLNNLLDSSTRNSVGSAAVIISGGCIALLGYRPLANFIARLMPSSIQVGTSIGIGLLTALAGATSINLVQKGSDNKESILQIGPISNQVIIAIFGMCMISVLTHYHLNGPFAITVVFCSIVWWTVENAWPVGLADVYDVKPFDTDSFTAHAVPVLVIDLVLLYVLYLSGLTTSLARLGDLVREDGTVPRARWIYVLVGLMTIGSGMLSGVPILISPEGRFAHVVASAVTLNCVLFRCSGGQGRRAHRPQHRGVWAAVFGFMLLCTSVSSCSCRRHRPYSNYGVLLFYSNRAKL